MAIKTLVSAGITILFIQISKSVRFEGGKKNPKLFLSWDVTAFSQA